MTQQSILHLVVNWGFFVVNICCFIARILFKISIFLVGLLIKLSLRSGGEIYTTVQNFVKIGQTVAEILRLTISKWRSSAILDF